MSEPICYVMVGLPGLGKSTLVAALAAMNPDVFVYSTDQFIEDAARHFGTTYDEAFEDNIKRATELMNTLLDEAIEHRLDIVWDQTNLGVGKRRKIINRMRQGGYQVRCECIVPPEAGWISDQKDWKYRLESRPGKTIPQNILTNMIRSFTLPTESEGFDMITFYNMHGALLGIDYGEKE